MTEDFEAAKGVKLQLRLRIIFSLDWTDYFLRLLDLLFGL